MALRLPDAQSLGERPVPQPNRQVAQYEPSRSAGLAGNIISSAGNELAQASQIIEQTNQKYDAIAADNALNKLQQAKTSLEFDPTSGFTSARGSAVVGQQFLKDYQGKFSDAVSEIGDGLQNQQQKQMFQQRAQMAASQFQSSLMAHQAQQTTIYANETDDASVKNSLNDIASHPYDDNVYNTSMNVGLNALNSKASRGGYSAPMIDNARTALTSAALYSRTAGMIQDNPMKAADFFHKHELEFDANTRQRLAGELKTVTDAQTSRSDADTAYHTAIGQSNPQSGPLPVDLGADKVKPYNADQILDITKQVKSASPYDAMFQKYAQIYNISPTELKLRAVAESGMKSGAVSSQGAVGLMQFTPETAKALGIDPNDPEQAIKGAAILMSKAGGTLGADMTATDRTYYGGNAGAKGPNTDQYVANLNSVRNAIYGQAPQIQTVASLEALQANVIKQAEATAESTRPGDLVYRDLVVAHATKNLSQDISAIRAQNYSDFSHLLGMSVGDSGAKNISDLSPADQTVFSHLPPENQHSLLNLWKSNQKQDDKNVPTPETDQKYLALQGQAINDPFGFKNTDIVAATQDLPRNQQQQIYSTWLTIDKNMAKGANIQQAISFMTRDMEIAKIKFPNAQGKQSAEALQPYNAYTTLLKKSVDDFMQQHSRAPTQEEVLGLGRPLLAQVKVHGASWFGFGDKTMSAYQVTPEQESQVIAPVTPEEHTKITNQLTQRYGYAPNESQVQALKTLSILHLNDPVALKIFDQTMRTNKPKGAETKITPAGGSQ